MLARCMHQRNTHVEPTMSVCYFTQVAALATDMMRDGSLLYEGKQDLTDHTHRQHG